MSKEYQDRAWKPITPEARAIVDAKYPEPKKQKEEKDDEEE